MGNNDEKTWLVKMATGDRNAFDKLFYHYWDEVYEYVMKVLRDHDDSSDVLQATFIALWEQRQKLTQIGSIRAYIFSIARFQAFNHLRRSKYQTALKSSLVNYFSDVAINPEDLYINSEIEKRIIQEIDSLPTKMKEIFVLSREDGLSYKEISSRLNVSENTVKKQISNSLRYLRVKLDEKHIFGLIFILLFK